MSNQDPILDEAEQESPQIAVLIILAFMVIMGTTIGAYFIYFSFTHLTIGTSSFIVSMSLAIVSLSLAILPFAAYSFFSDNYNEGEERGS